MRLLLRSSMKVKSTTYIFSFILLLLFLGAGDDLIGKYLFGTAERDFGPRHWWWWLIFLPIAGFLTALLRKLPKEPGPQYELVVRRQGTNEVFTTYQLDNCNLLEVFDSISRYLNQGELNQYRVEEKQAERLKALLREPLVFDFERYEYVVRENMKG